MSLTRQQSTDRYGKQVRVAQLGTHLALMVWEAGGVLLPLIFSSVTCSVGEEDVLFLKIGD